MGCRLDRARDWSVRLSHEATLHEESIFLTLTYDNDHIPPGATLVKRDVQLFMKRLRKSIEPRKVRFFAVGEYGDQNSRPHYHLLVFGWRPEDSFLWTIRNNENVFCSPSLKNLWPLGLHEFGSVTPSSANYVARYTLKSAGKDGKRYDRFDSETGETWTVSPEFSLMSRKPMLGDGWLKKFKSDCFPSDFLVIEGRKVPIPKAYKKRLTDSEADQARKRLVASGYKFDPKVKANSTDDRLAVREEVRREKIARLKREL